MLMLVDVVLMVVGLLDVDDVVEDDWVDVLLVLMFVG
jgi:hypothetical protein